MWVQWHRHPRELVFLARLPSLLLEGSNHQSHGESQSYSRLLAWGQGPPYLVDRSTEVPLCVSIFIWTRALGHARE